MTTMLCHGLSLVECGICEKALSLISILLACRKDVQTGSEDRKHADRDFKDDAGSEDFKEIPVKVGVFEDVV